MSCVVAFGRCVPSLCRCPCVRKSFVQQGIRQLFSAGKDREATRILMDHIMLVSPGADRQEMLRARCRFDESGKFGDWLLSGCELSKLPPSFGAVVCSGHLNLSYNNLESLPESFSEITVGRTVNLSRNRWLTRVPKNFPNVEGRVIR